MSFHNFLRGYLQAIKEFENQMSILTKIDSNIVKFSEQNTANAEKKFGALQKQIRENSENKKTVLEQIMPFVPAIIGVLGVIIDKFQLKENNALVDLKKQMETNLKRNISPTN